MRRLNSYFILPTDSVNYKYPSLVDLEFETHGGDDVVVFAKGPWAHLFTGNMEQNEIPLAMALAAGISTELPTSGSTGFNFMSRNILMASTLLGFRRFFW